MKFTKNFGEGSPTHDIEVDKNLNETTTQSRSGDASVESLPDRMVYEAVDPIITEEDLEKLAGEDNIPPDLAADFEDVDLKKTSFGIPVGINDQEGVPLVGNAKTENTEGELGEDGGALITYTPEKGATVEGEGHTTVSSTKENIDKLKDFIVERSPVVKTASVPKKEGETPESKPIPTPKDNIVKTGSGETIFGGKFESLTKKEKTNSATETPPASKEIIPPTPPTPPESTTPKKTRKTSLIDTIDAVNEKNQGVDIEEFGPARGIFRSMFNKLKIKMGWNRDMVAGFAVLKTKDKFNLAYGDFWNDVMINRKRRDLSKAERKAAKAERLSEQDKSERESKLEKIDSALTQAKKEGNQEMVDVLTKAREGLSLQTSRDLAGESKKNLEEQLDYYKQRKERILDGFIAKIDTQIETVRNNTDYYENLERRKCIDGGINELQDVVSRADSEILSLKVAMSAPGLDRIDRASIKDAIKEIKESVGESRSRLRYYERMRSRLNSFIERTDKRTDRFERYKSPYAKTRQRIHNRNNGTETPPESSPTPVLPPKTPEVDPENKNGAKALEPENKNNENEEKKIANTKPEGIIWTKEMEEKITQDVVKNLLTIGSFKEEYIGDTGKVSELYNSLKNISEIFRKAIRDAKSAGIDTSKNTVGQHVKAIDEITLGMKKEGERVSADKKTKAITPELYKKVGEVYVKLGNVDKIKRELKLNYAINK